MTRDGLPRAYLRIDPNIDQHPDPLSMVRAMCAAARQPNRGRFREAAVLERAVGRRQYRAMVARGDVVPATPGPGVYLDGWDEWQEGDHTVGDRMKRMRAKRKAKAVSHVTPPTSPDRNDVTTDAVAKGSASPVVRDSDRFSPSPAERGTRANGRNPRAVGSSPRQTGSSPRQVKEEDRRKAPVRLAAILEAAAREGRP